MSRVLDEKSGALQVAQGRFQSFSTFTIVGKQPPMLKEATKMSPLFPKH